MRFWRDVSLSAAVAGFVAVLVGFTSSVAIVFQAAQAFGADAAQISSWMWALGLGMGLTTLLASLGWRQPVMVAWSTPGAALLATAGAGYGMADAVGAFLLCGALITLAGATGWFERVMDRIPIAIASALLAGLLSRFALDAFGAARNDLPLVLLMLGAYLVGRRWWPRYAVVGVLVAGTLCVAARGQLRTEAIAWSLAMPVFTMPRFSLQATISLALPLFIVTMASQNLPGVAAIRAAGYAMPLSRLITLTGVATLVLAPFGAFALNLSAITAAICMGREAHEDPARRYTAAAVCGALYVLIGLFGAAVTGVLTAFPPTLVVVIAGLALLGTIGQSLAVALGEAAHRDAALITFLVTLSGVVIGGIGAAFWGVVAGGLALAVQRMARRAGSA